MSRFKWFVVSDKRTTKASELIFCLDSNNIPTSSKDILSSSISYFDYFRSCTKPAPGPGGDKCEGEEREELPCAAPTQCGQSDSLDKFYVVSRSLLLFYDFFPTWKLCTGVWSNWGDWGECTVSCGGGEQTRSETYDFSAMTS